MNDQNDPRATTDYEEIDDEHELDDRYRSVEFTDANGVDVGMIYDTKRTDAWICSDFVVPLDGGR